MTNTVLLIGFIVLMVICCGSMIFMGGKHGNKNQGDAKSDNQKRP